MPLLWAEAVTLVSETNVPNDIYGGPQGVQRKELVDLTIAVIAINGWNRLNVAFRTTPGTYEPGQFASAAS